MLISREQAAQLGNETVDILHAGRYQLDDGQTVDIREMVQLAVAGTVSYPPDTLPPEILPGNQQTQFEVRNETTLKAAHRLVEKGQPVAALNFASASHPGGGFLSGARAQEESLARSSGLYACLSGNPMYEFHQTRRDPLYTNYVIYSPNVPVFRTDEGELLKQPWPCSFITSPAPNAKVVLERDRSRHGEIHRALAERIYKVLAIARFHGHGVLILGAWGCGAFGNDSQEVAELFAEELHGPFRGVFTHIVFAITDWSEEKRFIGPFAKVFAA